MSASSPRSQKLLQLLVVVLLPFLLNAGTASAQVRPRLAEPIEDARRVTLVGNVHPAAKAEFDRGAAPLDLPMNRMLLVLKRSPEQEAEL